ncbi:hypothetical protein OESDEN_01333 [Oesophagostomum dentatum]|uniref:Uncharacterized protein n=1 Tax=Oesophagostomum dentatum TaxID=61180 RepID=A0A0B1TRI3_OESDE|nr:hypothetical protein OESDEN_01333 [Oesophagostomum dentatum]
MRSYSRAMSIQGHLGTQNASVLMAAERNQFFGLDEDEEVMARNLAAKALITSITYPLTCAKTLIQLGHEPFPLSTGRTLIVAGRNAYFLPNVFSYASQLAHAHGLGILFTGIDSAVCSLIIQGITAYHTKKYIDKYYPEIGGKPEYVDVEEKDLTDHQSFKRQLRVAIRESVVRVATVTVARPLTGTTSFIYLLLCYYRLI